MPNLSVRNIDETTVRLLRLRAAEQGVSMEEAVRRILRTAVAQPRSLADVADSLFGAENGIELTLSPHVEHEPVSFEP